MVKMLKFPPQAQGFILGASSLLNKLNTTNTVNYQVYFSEQRQLNSQILRLLKFPLLRKNFTSLTPYALEDLSLIHI